MNREVIKNAPRSGGKPDRRKAMVASGRQTGKRTLWRMLADAFLAGVGPTRRPHQAPEYPEPYRPREQRQADDQAVQAAKDAAEAKRRRRRAKRLRDWEGRRS
jgi:hypothetical protein